MAILVRTDPSQLATDSPASKSERLYYLDWLRVLAIVGVFLYHASRPFIMQEWLINNEERSVAITFLFLVFFGSWGMPLFFLVAGTSSYFALRRRNGRQFVTERLQRLLVPFVVGCILLSPLQFYLEWLHKGWYEGSFLSFLPVLAQDRLARIGATFSPTIFESLGSHLWFLGFLLSISLVALPLFLWFGGDAGQRFIRWLAVLGARRGGIFIFAVPVVLIRLFLQPYFPAYADCADFCYMLVFFIFGYIMSADGRLTQAIRRDGKSALFLGLLATAFMILALAAGGDREWAKNPTMPGFYLAWGLASINSWCWTIFALSFGMTYLSSSSRWLNYGQRAIVPFFLLHQPVIVVIAFFVVDWQAPIALKLPLIMLSAFAITVALYELLVRRVGPAQALFGMK